MLRVLGVRGYCSLRKIIVPQVKRTNRFVFLGRKHFCNTASQMKTEDMAANICVYEQEVKNQSARSCEQILEETLNHYEEVVKTAHENQCCLVVFPEMGVMTGMTQQQRFQCSEIIPDINTLPTDNNSAILKKISKLCQNYSCNIALNLIEKTIIGTFYNTTVVLGKNGCILGKHRKKHLYLEPGLSPDMGVPSNIFIEGIGSVGFITCFDILARGSHYRAAQKADLTIFISQWYDESPQYTALSIAQAHAVATATPTLAVNCRSLRMGTLGSGLIWPDGVASYSLSFDLENSKIHIFQCKKPTHSIRDPHDSISLCDAYRPFKLDLSRFDRLPLCSVQTNIIPNQTLRKGYLAIDLSTVTCKIQFEYDPSKCPDVQWCMLASDGLRSFTNGDQLYLRECLVAPVRKDNETGRSISYKDYTYFESLKMVMTPKISEHKDSTAILPMMVGEDLTPLPAHCWTYHADQRTLIITKCNLVCIALSERLFSKDRFKHLHEHENFTLH